MCNDTTQHSIREITPNTLCFFLCIRLLEGRKTKEMQRIPVGNKNKKSSGPQTIFHISLLSPACHTRSLVDMQRLQLIMTTQQQQQQGKTNLGRVLYIVQMSSSLAVSRFVCLLHIAVKNRSAVPSIKQMTFLGRIGWLLLYMREEK